MIFKHLLIALAATLTLAACGGGDKPEEVAKSFFEAVADGDSDEATGYLFIPEDVRKEAGSEEIIEGKVKMIVGQGKSKFAQNNGLDEVSTGEVEYNSDNTTATVPITITFKNGSKTTEKMRLIKTDDGWKIKI